ncbi:MAG TPA: phage tail protein [Longimicrobium sp.]|nr:phage tail protein [Longimicrobium sp.]
MAAAKRWRLSGANGWGAGLSAGRDVPVAADAEGVVPGRAALALRPAGGGPLDPAALPASVGGLTLPRNVALHGDELLLAGARRRRALRYDAGRKAFVSFVSLPGITAADAPVLDRAGDLLVFSTVHGARVLALHARARLVFDDVTLPNGHRLRDLIATPSGEVLLLSARPGAHAAVWAWRPGREGVVRRALLRPSSGESVEPARLLTDAKGRVHVFESAGSRLLALEEDGSAGGEWMPVDEARERFAPLPVAVEPDPARGWRMRVPPDFGSPSAAPVPWPAPPAWPAFGPGGERLELPPETQVGRRPYGTTGRIVIGPLDAGLPRATWDRVELEIGALPAGTAVRVSTRTSDSSTTPADDEAPWSAPHRVVGPSPASSKDEKDTTESDVAVLSAPGQYLWLRLELDGGSATPAVRAATAVYPRRGIADYLPAVFREQDQDTRFLERFVGALEGTWGPLERAVGDFDRELRPETAGEAMLAYLASWLDQPLDPAWSAAARRRAVRHAAEHLFRRGTPSAVAAALRLHLASRWGIDPDRVDGPFVWEHFRSRLPARAGAGDGAPAALFGSEVMRRLRLGASALGEGTLRDLGTPETDPVTVHAHRFSVYVPRALAPTPADVQALQAVLKREQPAGTVGEVVLVEPRLRLGAQATLGVDTVLGVYPVARLAAAGDADAPAARLDYDCMLAGAEPGAHPETPAVGAPDGALPWRIS